MTDQTKKTIHSTTIVFSFLIFSAFFAYLFRLLLARNLSIEEFGLFFSLTALANIFLIIRDLGMNQVVLYHIPRLIVKNKMADVKAHVKKLFFVETIMAAVIMLLFIAFSDFLSTHYFHYNNSKVLVIFGFAFFLNSIELNLQLMFQSFQKYFFYSLHNFLRNFLVFIVAYFAMGYTKNVFTAIVSYIFVFIMLLLIFSTLFFKKTFPNMSKIKNKELDYKQYYKFCLYGMLSFFGYILIGSIDTFLLTYFSNLESVGIYNAAVPIITLMLYLPVAIGIIIIPLSAELWAKKKFNELKSLTESISKYIAIYLCVFAGILVSFPAQIISILFGSSFEKSATCLVILAIGAIFFGIANVFTNFTLGIHGPKKNFKTYFISIIITTIFALMLIPIYDIEGAAIAASLGYFAIFVLSILQAKEFIDIKKIAFNILKALLCAAIIPITISYLKKIHVLDLKWAIISTITAIAFYMLLLILFKVIKYKEITELGKIALRR